MHYNINGLKNKTHVFEYEIKDFENLQYLCITEHHLPYGDYSNFAISEYKMCSIFARQHKKCGGALIMSNKDCLERSDIIKLSVEGHFECCAVDTSIADKNCTIVCVYRPPSGDIKMFFKLFEKVGNMIKKSKREPIFCGDFNINLFEKKVNTHDFEEIMSLSNLYPLFNQATRICDTTSTLIDNVIVSENIKELVSSIQNVDIVKLSDHKAQFVHFDVCKKEVVKIKRKVRIYSKKNCAKFEKLIQSEKWDKVKTKNLGNDKFNEFHDKFTSIFESSFPLISKTYTDVPIKCSNWKTPGLRISKRKLYLLDKLRKINPDTYSKQYVKRYKKIYYRLVELSKQICNSNKVLNSDDKGKTMWQILNSRKGSKSHKKNKGLNLKIDGDLVKDPQKIADAFSNYFEKSVDDIKDSIGDAIHDKDPLSNIAPIEEVMFLNSVTEKDVKNAISKLKNKRSFGFDGIPDFLIKQCGDGISEILAHIINTCFQQATFPSKLRQSIVRPVYKKGPKDDITNYRPVSLLSVFSKIFEKIFLYRLLHFLKSNNILSKFQHGFRAGLCTETAIFNLVNGILEDIDKKRKSCGIFVDLSKAFDCIVHDILYSKCHRYGIQGSCLQWIKSYLSGRSQCTEITGWDEQGNEIKSSSHNKPLKYGVPQGSILGPVLFLIYINDLPDYCLDNEAQPTLYADDSNVHISATDNEELIVKAADGISFLESWFSMNGLVMNRKKTEIVPFRTIQTTDYLKENIIFENDTFELSDSIKFLGVVIDPCFRWCDHVLYLRKRLASVIFAINELKSVVDLHALKALYYANFNSLISYGVIFWGDSIDSNKIFVLQKRVLRSMLKLRYHEHCRDYFQLHEILPLPCLYILECVTFVKKYYLDFFPDITVSHPYNTRNKNKELPMPKTRLKLVDKGPMCKCILLYNKLPCDIKLILKISTFRIEVKSFLLQHCFYSVQEYLTLN